MDLIYTDAGRNDIGVLKDYTFDLAIGSDENDFELTMGLECHCCEVGSLVYVEGTEYGGVIDGLMVKGDTVTYRGRTWHGILASKVIQPDTGYAYLSVYGDAHTIISDLIVRLGIDDLFVVPTELSGLVIENYSFDRYVDAYTGISKMLRSLSWKLKFTSDRSSVILSVEPVVDYSKDDQFDSDTVEMQIEKTPIAVNHLICLGRGELAERSVVHLYVDGDGNIGQTQTFFRSQEVVAVYDYPSAESNEELVKNGTEKLQEYANANRVQLNFTVEDDTYDIGDIIGAKEVITGTFATARIMKKIVTIRQGLVNVQYEVGE